jgi:hypothetical protein
MRIATSVFIFVIAALALKAQAVGDEVRYQCFCFGQEWVKATIERIDANNVKVRFGNMDNQVVTLPRNSPKLRMGSAARNPLESVPPDNLQKAFMADAAPRFSYAVSAFAPYYDPQFNPVGGGKPDSDIWRKSVAELGELDALCRTRYRGITDYRSPGYIRDGSVDYRFGVWCDIAANRVEVEKKARVGVAKTLINLGYTDENLRFGFNEPDNPVRWETQQLIWERDKWRSEKIAWLRPKYAEYKVDVPADATAAAEAKADELKAIVMRDAPNRSYKQPPYRDAAAEAVVKSAFAKEYPGVQVVKIGLDYTTWVQRKSLDYVASDDIFRYYKVSYNSYKRGTALLKIPGRPFCQMHDWVVGRSGGSIVPAGVGGSGTFMRCE